MHKHRIPHYQTMKIGENIFRVDDRYHLIDIIGLGHRSVIVAAKDTSKGEKVIKQTENKPNYVQNIVAIKKIKNTFHNIETAYQTLKQLRLLRLLKHPNIVELKIVMRPQQCQQQLNDIYCIVEIMDTNLQTLIKSQLILQSDHQRFFIYQLLKGLKYLHSAKIIHGDLKTQCILVNEDCDLKITQFIYAELQNEFNQNYKPCFKNIQSSRLYLAPQILLQSSRYTTAVDIWSTGCIFAEIVKRRPFLPDIKSSQIQVICEYIGTPNFEINNNKTLLDFIPKHKNQLIKKMMKNHKQPKDFNKLFPTLCSQVFEPSKRLTAVEALQHSYFDGLHDITQQPCRQSLNLAYFEFRRKNISLDQYRQLIYEQIMLHHDSKIAEKFEFKMKSKSNQMRHEQILKSLLQTRKKK